MRKTGIKGVQGRRVQERGDRERLGEESGEGEKGERKLYERGGREITKK